MKTENDWALHLRELISREFAGVTPQAINSAVVAVALRVGNEMADARAEEIASDIEDSPRWSDPREERRQAAALARSTITKPKEPKTREQVLEEALRSVSYDAIEHGLDFILHKTKSALEWKP